MSVKLSLTFPDKDNMKLHQKIWAKIFKPIINFYRIGRYWINLILSPILILLSLVYILNPTFGIIELLPDNIPVVGNLDEFIASVILIFSTRLFFRLLFKKASFQKENEQALLEAQEFIDIESNISNDDPLADEIETIKELENND